MYDMHPLHFGMWDSRTKQLGDFNFQVETTFGIFLQQTFGTQEMVTMLGFLVQLLAAFSSSRSSEQSSSKVRDISNLISYVALQHQPQHQHEEFLLPLLSYQVGAGNQQLEYMSAAVVARALNRTLCLTPFFEGPLKHLGHTSRMLKRGKYLSPEHRYDLGQLSKFVKTASLETCLRECNRRLNAYWILRASRKPMIKKWSKGLKSLKPLNLDQSFAEWLSMRDIANMLGGSHEQCVALGGLLPGLRWRGSYLAVALYLKPSNYIREAAYTLRELTVGTGKSFLAVHWRFEESDCGGQRLGLCFARCDDGAVINSGEYAGAGSSSSWNVHTKQECPPGKQYVFRRVWVTEDDIVGAIYSTAETHKLDSVYLATDGWMRGHNASLLIKEVVERLRGRGLKVTGLWRVKQLPNLSDGSFIDFTSLGAFLGMSGENETLSSTAVSLVEQELCRKAKAFLGSGQSTWSLTVFYQRLARRKAQELQSTGMEENEVVEELLRDMHEAGLVCRFHAYYYRSNNMLNNRNSSSNAREEQEDTDGWLDLEACEKRIARGGGCKIAACF